MVQGTYWSCKKPWSFLRVLAVRYLLIKDYVIVSTKRLQEDGCRLDKDLKFGKSLEIRQAKNLRG